MRGGKANGNNSGLDPHDGFIIIPLPPPCFFFVSRCCFFSLTRRKKLLISFLDTSPTSLSSLSSSFVVSDLLTRNTMYSVLLVLFISILNTQFLSFNLLLIHTFLGLAVFVPSLPPPAVNSTPHEMMGVKREPQRLTAIPAIAAIMIVVLYNRKENSVKRSLSCCLR
jgi:hypothetical protein